MKDTHVDTTITTLEFCAGYGGIGLGLKNIFGERLRCLAYCELEGFAQANLISKMEKGLLDVAPLWNDLKTFPYGKFHGLVDILIAGYPCQPFSAAGKRAGKDDPRHLWPWIADGIRLLRPRACFLENVEGHISLGLSTVVSDLEELGYKVSWGIFSASEVGAPHQRKRVFIMAHRSGEGFQGREWIGQTRTQGASSGHATECSSSMADSSGNGHNRRELQDRVERWSSSQLPQPRAGESCGVWSETIGCGQAWPSRPGEQQFAWEPPRVVNSNRDGCIGNVSGDEAEQVSNGTDYGLSGAAGAMGNAPQREDHGREPRDMGLEAGQGRCGDHAADGAGEVLADNLRGRLPHATDQQRNIGADDHAIIRTRLTESGGRQAQPSLGRDADGPAGGMDYAELFTTCDNRTDELRLLGNGVVPATAERAFRVLMEELSQEK
jgi:site-specific DNA-cytosine methylase